MTSTTHPHDLGSDRVQQLVRRHPSVVHFARAGWVAKGLVYFIAGLLALPIVFDSFGEGNEAADGEASQQGAVAKLAEQPIGTVALWIVAGGLLLYAMWRLISIVLPAENSAKAWLTRIGYGISTVVYILLASSAISFARHKRGSGTSEDAKVESFTRDLMERTGGRWLVGIIGAIVIGVGATFVHRGATAEFRKELRPGSVGPIPYRSIERLGQIGWVGRGAMMAIIGFFLVRAAVTFEPSEAQGIDGSLRDAASSGLGAAAVVFVAVALMLYGVFCVVSAPLTQLRSAS